MTLANKRRRRADRRKQKLKTAADAPRRHVLRSPLDRMKRRGSLNVWELTAADEIMHAYHVSIGLPAPRDPMLGVPYGNARPDAADNAAGWRVDLLAIYRRWRADLRDTPALRATVSLLIDERSSRDTERLYRWRNGTAVPNLRVGLRHFSALRGNTPRGSHGWRYTTGADSKVTC